MIKDIETPALVIDLQKMDENIKMMADRAEKSGIKLRPHIKTHKSHAIALQQLKSGAEGITVAKIGEAEVMAHYGIKNILIAYPIIGETKLNRLQALAEKIEIIVSLDSVEVAEGISKVGKNIGKDIRVYIEVDTGLGRVGRRHGAETLDLVEKVVQLPNIEVYGLMTHAGHSYKAKDIDEMKRISKQEGQYLVETKEMIKQELGITVPVISVGSTPTSYIGGQVEGVTEMRPGTYVFNDATLIALGIIKPEDCALTIHSTVVSKPADDRAIIDAGSKTLTSDKPASLDGHGYIRGQPDTIVSWLSEEHGVLSLPENSEVNIGDVIEIVPNHVCPTVNLADELIGIRDGKVVETIEVDARGKNK